MSNVEVQMRVRKGKILKIKIGLCIYGSGKGGSRTAPTFGDREEIVLSFKCLVLSWF